MSLESFELLPRGETGWGSGAFAFGTNTTLLLGPNGSGKTPLIKAIIYCLGYPAELPPLVREKCSTARLRVGLEEGAYVIERELAPGVDARITAPDGLEARVADERTLSEWSLRLLKVASRSLLGRRGEAIPPYMSVVGPMFLVDQDTGWVTPYAPFPTHDFVKDQREEVARWLLDIPSKHRAIDKSEFQASKTKLAGIQEEVAFKRAGLEALMGELGEDRAPDALQRLEERKAALESQLLQSYSIIEGLSSAGSVFDSRIEEATKLRTRVSQKIANVGRRKRQLVEARSEIGAELSALEQSEIAAEAFRSLCGNESCQFFRRPEESYGRRVLYLKDQLKDFELSTGEAERELDILQDEMNAADRALEDAAKLKETGLKGTDAEGLLLASKELNRELSDIHARINRIQRFSDERRALDAKVAEEARANDEVQELRPTAGPKRDNARLLDARQNLAESCRAWLGVLGTPNIPDDITFDEELRLVVGGERFSSKSSQSGSTRTRLVLAYHAAFLETSLLMGGAHPRLLVLDAPRQHELRAEDLRAFVDAFHRMSIKRGPVQLVFSATDAAIVAPGSVDEIWRPPFELEGKPRFLGPSPQPR